MSNFKTKKPPISKMHLTVILVIAVVLAYLLPRSLAAGGTAIFSVEPVATSVAQGDPFTISIFVTPTGANIFSSVVSVNLPPQLQYQSFSNVGSNFTLSAPQSGDTLGSTKVLIVSGFTPPNSGAAGSKLLIGKIVAKATSTLGTGSITLTDNQAQDPSETFFTTTVSNTTVTVTPPAQPDLVITGITTTPAAPAIGDAVTFAAQVKNQGTLATTAGVNHSVKFLIDGTTTIGSAAFTTAIPVAGTATISSVAGTTWPAVVGNHTVVATVDDTNLIVESNETNNSFSKSIAVTDNQPPVVSFTFPGVAANEVLVAGTAGANDTIVVRSLGQVVVKPTVTDNIGVTTTAYKVNNAAVTLTAGQFTLPNQNADYIFNVAASDAASNTLNKTITVKTRSPDITRDGRVKIEDFTTMLTQWGTNNPQTDLDANGTVGIGDFTKLLLAWTN